MTQAWRQLLATWSRLDGRFRAVVVCIAAAAVLTWLSSPLYVLAVMVIAAAAVLVYRVSARFRWRGLAAAGVLLLTLVGLGRVFQGVANPAPHLPSQPPPIMLNVPPTQQQVQALVAEDPGSSETWMAAGFYLQRLRPTDPGVVAFERVLLMDPTRSRAALELAATFLGFGSTPVDRALATYYTAVAGYPAPDLSRQP
jgi:cytochrome c-type biogenesis protein CcmH/NrfG